MADGTTTTTSSEPTLSSSIQSELKHRRAHHPSFSERGTARRSSLFSQNSILTDSSSEPQPFSIRSSTEDLLSPRASGNAQDIDNEAGYLQSLPILFAIFPAIGGLLFKRGSVLITDLALLVFAGIYLNWCLVTPWTWYRSAQSRIAETYISEDAIDDPLDTDTDTKPSSTNNDTDTTNPSNPPTTFPSSPKTSAAASELRIHEILALTLCFLGPLLGSYILHIIRHSLSRVSDDLVSEMHLTLFVLCAEIRPIRHAIKLTQARTLFLQRVVRESPSAGDGQVSQDDVTVLREAILELESSLSELSAQHAVSTQNSEKPKKPILDDNNSDLVKRIQLQQNQLQSQTDALTRAVRRYEKRATAQSMQTEARLQDLEIRLREALTLAAAAANVSGRNQGVVAGTLGMVGDVLMLPVKAAKAVVEYPMGVVDRMLNEAMGVFGLSRRGSRVKVSRGAGAAR